MILSIALLFAFFCTYYLFLMFGSIRKSIHETDKIKLQDITVLIPFRNEKEHLKTLIATIKHQAKYPKLFVFIDDHSSDGSDEIIVFDSNIAYKILHLNQASTGKKAALSKGLEFCETDFYLTLDADISLPINYFENLEKLPCKDLWILPVEINNHKKTSSIWEFEQELLLKVNQSANKLYRPIMASGANLLIKKTTYDQHQTYFKTQHISSGDDMFLLHDFINSKATIALYSDENLKVSTSSFSSFSKNIDQRIRWISKNKKIKDSFADLIGLWGLLAILSSHAILILLVVSKDFVYMSLMLLIFLTMVAFLFIKNKKTRMYPVFLNVYPYLGIYIFVCSLIKKPKWKDRLIDL